jgi:HAD superfamily hydrolase (TIGR01450 family)
MGQDEMGQVARSLPDLKGFAFDLDGTIWEGPALLPDAAALVADIRSAGLGVIFASNCSRHGSSILSRQLVDLGIDATPTEVVTPFDLVGEAIRRRLGAVRVLVLGTDNLADVLTASGHVRVRDESWDEAQAVVVGVDHDFSYDRLRAAARAVSTGAAFFAVNLDANFPVGQGLIDPGCGALAEAIAVAGRTRPVAIGKPELPLFQFAIERLRCQPEQAAMVGDSLSSDIAGGRAAGMFTIWIDASGRGAATEDVDLTIQSLGELHQLWRRSSRRSP